MITDDSCFGDAKNCTRNDLTTGEHPYEKPGQEYDVFHINGWHFRNVDNTGPNLDGPGHVDAPPPAREFRFASSVGEIRAMLPRRLYCSHKVQMDKLCAAKGQPQMAQICGTFVSYNCDGPSLELPNKATFTIDKYELTDPVQGQKAGFKSMNFIVTGTVASADKPAK
jgi:hypothetical protein